MAIFFADDGLQIAQTVEEANIAIKALILIAGECGLEINKTKSSILTYNMKDPPGAIEGIEVTNSVKYLGTKITNKRNCFKEHKD